MQCAYVLRNVGLLVTSGVTLVRGQKSTVEFCFKAQSFAQTPENPPTSENPPKDTSWFGVVVNSDGHKSGELWLI